MKKTKTNGLEEDKNLKKPSWKLKLVIYTPSKIKQKFEDYDMEYKKQIPLMLCTALMVFGAIAGYD